MLKLLNTSVAKLVGATSAVVFQHICYWMQTQQREIIYRTNKQLSEDLDGIYSPQQIQRAKKKLIEEGLIVVTADKRDAWNRTSHYSLTEKGRALLLSINTTKDSNKNTHKTLAVDTQNRSDSTKEVKTNRKPSENKQAKYERSSNVHVMSNNALEHNSAMRESFKEGFSNANAVPMPDNIKNLIKGKLKKTSGLDEVVSHKEDSWLNEIEDVDSFVDELIEVNDQSFDSPKLDDFCDSISSSFEYDDDYYPKDNDQCPTDSEYNDSVIAMLAAIDKQNSRIENERNSPAMSFAELMKTAYNKATTEAQEQMYRMKQEMQQYKYCEDF